MEQARHADTAGLLDRVHGALAHFNRELKRIDPYLQLVRADPRSEHPLLRPGYYHLIRTPPDGPPSVRVVQGPDGEFREPDSSLFEELQRDDLWSDRSRRQRQQRQRELARAAEREKEHETLDRREEMYQRLRSKVVTSVAVPG